jgi:hypothetical protein
VKEALVDMGRILVGLIAVTLLGQETAQVSVTPVSSSGFSAISQLSNLNLALMNVWIENDSSLTVTVGMENVALGCSAIYPLTVAQASLFLTNKQKVSFWKTLADLLPEAVLGLAVFYSPWAITGQPVTSAVQNFVNSRVPDETAVIGFLSQTSVTVAAGGKGFFSLLASLVKNAPPPSCKITWDVVPAPMVQPPPRLRLRAQAEEPKQPTLAEIPWIHDEILGVTKADPPARIEASTFHGAINGL